MPPLEPAQSEPAPNELLHKSRKGAILPLLKWAGSKRALAPSIQALFSGPCLRYVEPFFGSGAAYLGRTEHPPALLADASPRLMGFHRAVQANPHDLLAEYGALPRVVRDRYSSVRTAFNHSDDHENPAQAARFLWLNKCCFNGLYRVNRSGSFNVGPGDSEHAPVLDEAHVLAVSDRLQNAELRLADFADTMAGLRAGDHVYADPPYVPLSSRASWTGYTAGGFAMKQQYRLALLSRRAAARGAVVAVSNHLTELSANSLYAAVDGWHLARLPKVRRAIGGRGAERAAVREVVAMLRPS